MNPGLRYLKALFHSAPAPRGLPAGAEGLILEADSTERKRKINIQGLHLFIYLSGNVCVLGRVARSFCLGKGTRLGGWSVVTEGTAEG